MSARQALLVPIPHALQLPRFECETCGPPKRANPVEVMVDDLCHKQSFDPVTETVSGILDVVVLARCRKCSLLVGRAEMPLHYTLKVRWEKER